MIFRYTTSSKLFFLTAIASIVFLNAAFAQNATKWKNDANVNIAFEKAHAWRPPFGLDRVGRSMELVVTKNKTNAPKELLVTFFSNGVELDRRLIHEDSVVTRLLLHEQCNEVVIYEKTAAGKWNEMIRKTAVLPAFECDAAARPEQVIHPVDLGAIMVPANWLLLSAGQQAIVDIALISRSEIKGAHRVVASYASNPTRVVAQTITIPSNRKIYHELKVTPPATSMKNDVLHVSVVSRDNKTVWRKEIPVMIVHATNNLPSFGVVKTKLRYDVPITNIVNGKNRPFSYDTAWSPEMHDYVVFLPNGSRWVFWRGASYIPIWVSKFNTGLSYEWAERISPNEGFTDCPEPLMDKQLRYASVNVIESTPARIHVRWSYQSCDFNYKVNGDFAYEDYYFYPDGIGTRVLTLTSIPEAQYEVAEFILLAPPAAIPFDVMPHQPMDIISYNSGKSSSLTLPQKDTSWNNLPDPLIYRMKVHKKDSLSAFSFNPLLMHKPFAFAPFRDKGLIVTPAYWGGHWPLSQGFNTGRSINESIWSGPSHNSLITWGPKRPQPIRSKMLEAHDALGVKKEMKEETWVWLIGMTAVSNDSLLQIAKSFAEPPVLRLKGARQEPDGYASERRAVKLIAESDQVNITIQPRSWCVNPVFEIKNAAAKLDQVMLDGKELSSKQYAWDGNTLWVKAHFNNVRMIELSFKP